MSFYICRIIYIYISIFIHLSIWIYYGAVLSKAMEGSPSLRTTFKATFMLRLLRQEPDLITYTSLISAAAKKRDLKASCCSRFRFAHTHTHYCHKMSQVWYHLVSPYVAICNKLGAANGQHVTWIRMVE